MSSRVFCDKALLTGRAFLLDGALCFMGLTDLFDMEQSTPAG
jgi:hypothetical protein